MRLARYPLNADGTPMDLLTAVLTDASGNNGARLTNPPQSPDGSPIDVKGLVLLDILGNPISLAASASAFMPSFVACAGAVVNPNVTRINTVFFSIATGRGGAIYDYTAAVNAAYVAANPLTSFITADGRGWRLSAENLMITPFMTGATADGATLDYPAFAALIAALKIMRTQPNTGYGSGSLSLFIPAGTYNLGSTTLDITHTLRIRGESTAAGGGATVLKWNSGTTGIRVQSFNTTGATAVITPNPSDNTSGQGSIIEGLLLQGNYAGTESEAHGIHLRGDATIRDCGIYGFAGDGIHVNATAGSGAPNEGNDNNSRFENLLIQDCRNGLFIDGSDTNACTAISIDAIDNRGFGVWDSSFLGNTHMGHQAAGNGAVPGTHPPCWVTQGGNRYVVKRGQEVGASTNAPSGTTADNTWWYYYSAGGTNPGLNLPAWVSGTTYRAGGAYCTDDSGSAANVFMGCYIEGSQPFAQFVTPTLVLGGSMRPNMRGVATLYGNGANIASDGGLLVAGNVQGQGNLHTLGVDAGNDLEIDLRAGAAGATEVGFWAWLAGVLKGYIRNINGIWYINGTSGIHLRYNGADAVVVDSTGLVHQSGFNPTLTEIAAVSVPAPAAGAQTLFIDTADHKLKRKDSTNAVTIIA